MIARLSISSCKQANKVAYAYLIHPTKKWEREIYLQKNVLICDIGVNKMYVRFVIWVF
jgi:hypothetical protein